jgi:hypothetical protein
MMLAIMLAAFVWCHADAADYCGSVKALTDSDSDADCLLHAAGPLSDSECSDAPAKPKIAPKPGGRRELAELRLRLRVPCECVSRRSGNNRHWKRSRDRGSCYAHFVQDGWDALVEWRTMFGSMHKLDQDRLVLQRSFIEFG